jgi:hypothetical protein
LDEILTVSRLGLPAELRRSLACTNIIENMMGTVRRVTRNVKCWSSPSMALRWTAATMHEAKKGFRRLKAFRQLSALRAALAAHYEKATTQTQIGRIGNLVQAAAIFDVYFSADLDQRFGAAGRRAEIAGEDGRLDAVLNRRADRLKAIAAARDQWQTLRRSTLSPAAISAALVPPNVSRRNYRHRDPELSTL